MENQKRMGGEASGAAVTGGPAKRGTSGRDGGEGSGACARVEGSGVEEIFLREKRREQGADLA